MTDEWERSTTDEEDVSLLGRDPETGDGGDAEADLHGDRLAEAPDAER